MITNLWEYKIVKGSNAHDEKYLNSIGKERWKLCGVVHAPTEGTMLYFMRGVHVCYPGPPD